MLRVNPLPLLAALFLGMGIGGFAGMNLAFPSDDATEPSDPYEGWSVLEAGGIVSFRLPPGCSADAAAGSRFVICPDEGNDTPTPEMVVSSDGIVVHVRRWEGNDWEHWDAVVASMRVLVPLDRDIEITVEG